MEQHTTVQVGDAQPGRIYIYKRYERFWHLSLIHISEPTRPY